MALANRHANCLCFGKSRTCHQQHDVKYTDFSQIAGAMVFTVPESPRYLYKEGRNQEAMEVLCQVYDGEPDSPVIVREQKDILDALALEKMHGEYRWSQLLKRDEVQTGYRVLLAYGMQFMNQMGGINLVV